jgi:hypothetical protein
MYLSRRNAVVLNMMDGTSVPTPQPIARRRDSFGGG